jgi:hypothetical protein
MTILHELTTGKVNTSTSHCLSGTHETFDFRSAEGAITMLHLLAVEETKRAEYHN